MKILSNLVRSLRPDQKQSAPITVADIRELFRAKKLEEAALAIERLHPLTPKRYVVLLCLRAELSYRRRDDAEAEKFYRWALDIEAGYPEAHYGLSLMFLEQGEAERALRHGQMACNADRNEARYVAQLGRCHLDLGNLDRARTALMRATRLNRSDAAVWNNLAIVFSRTEKVEEALRCYHRALSIDPGFAKAADNLATLEEAIRAQGYEVSVASTALDLYSETSRHSLEQVVALEAAEQMDQAIDECEALGLEQPDDAQVVIKLHRLYQKTGDPSAGLSALVAFLLRRPDDLTVVAEYAVTLIKQRNLTEAEPLLQRALDQNPDHVPLLLAMGDLHSEKLAFEKAGVYFDKVYRLDPSFDHRGHLASSLLARCKYRDALEIIESMIAEVPRAARGLLGNRVIGLTQLGRHEEALSLISHALEKEENDPGLRFMRATILLPLQRFESGWDDYAYRNLYATEHLRMLPFTEWHGEPMEGKSIVVLSEQGLGDQVMFASCLPDLIALNPKRVLVEVVHRVSKTIKRSFPDCEFVPTKQDRHLKWLREHGEFDYFVSIGDLPRQFRRSRNAFPHHDGYLKADPSRVAWWAAKLEELGPGPKLGVSWRGGTESTRRTIRTMNVEDLLPLQDAVPSAIWICLQYGEVKEDLARARAKGLVLHFWEDAITDLDEFAALIEALDHVVTVCNTTVHYAGALGKGVWVMSPKFPEWRYGWDTEALPWYPSSKIYRQSVDGEWTPMVQEIGRDLAALLGHG